MLHHARGNADLADALMATLADVKAAIDLKVDDLMAIGPQAIGPQVIDLQVIGPQVIGPQVIDLKVIGPQVIDPQVDGKACAAIRK